MTPTAAPARKRPARKPPRKPPPRKPAAAKAKRASKRPAARRRTARKPAPPRPSSRGRFSWRARILASVALIAALGAGYVFWLRDSSLVAVTDVEVVGVTTSDRAEIVGSLTAAAKEMTTLHADADRLSSVAGRFPSVRSIDVEPNFPHGMRIEVDQRPPRLLVEVGGEQTPVAADGTLLAGVEPPQDQNLPVLELAELPAQRLEGEPLEQAMVAGAAPDPLLGLIEEVGYSRDFGPELTLRGGIEVRFGSAEGAPEKWAATAAVLADPKLDVACYVDVRVPERAAVGCAG